MATQTTGTVPIADRRTPPRGVLPRGAQTWLMAALAVGLLAIVLVTGRPAAPASPTPPSANPAVTPSADRLRDYQDRLRVLDERNQQPAQAADPPPSMPTADQSPRPSQADPLAEDRRRREYE